MTCGIEAYRIEDDGSCLRIEQTVSTWKSGIRDQSVLLGILALWGIVIILGALTLTGVISRQPAPSGQMQYAPLVFGVILIVMIPIWILVARAFLMNISVQETLAVTGSDLVHKEHRIICGFSNKYSREDIESVGVVKILRECKIPKFLRPTMDEVAWSELSMIVGGKRVDLFPDIVDPEDVERIYNLIVERLCLEPPRATGVSAATFKGGRVYPVEKTE